MEAERQPEDKAAKALWDKMENEPNMKDLAGASKPKDETKAKENPSWKDDAKLAGEIIKRFSKLKSCHSNWRGVWEQCARYCMPNASPLKVIGSRTEGSMKRQPLDTTGIDAATKLASWLYSSTIFQGEEWFSLKARKKGRNGTIKVDNAMEKFLQEAARIALETINNSNCIQVYQQFLRGYVNFGTGVFYSEFNDNGELICKQFNITEDVCIAENSSGEVDTVIRQFEYTARQAVQEFGWDNLSGDIKDAASSVEQQDKRFKFIHAVYPRMEREKDKVTPDNKPFASVYVEVDKQKIVLEGGYDTFPYCVPRFYNTGEVYGRSPAMSAIPALRSINIATYFYLRNVEFSTNPMAFVPAHLVDKIRIGSGEVNPWDDGDGKVQLWSPSGDMRSPLEFASIQKEAVKGIFFNDVFQYLEDRKNMTATEAQLRYDEMIQGIAPVLANLHNEFFSRFIRRVVLSLCADGRIHVPEVYKDKDGSIPDFEVVYTTRLDTKLKGVLNANIINFIRMVGEYSVAVANAPMAAAYLDSDEIIKLFAANNNVSNEVLNDDETIQKNLEDQAKQAQMNQILGKLKDIDFQQLLNSGAMGADAQGGIPA